MRQLTGSARCRQVWIPWFWIVVLATASPVPGQDSGHVLGTTRPSGRVTLSESRANSAGLHRTPVRDQIAAGDWMRVLTFRDYNTRVVVFGTLLLGAACGVVGSFTLLRRRALMGDALSHATLPGIASAFLLVTAWGGEGKSLWVLLIGAAVSGLLGTIAILAIRNYTRLKEDTALGIVLSVFFGMGVALLGIVQQSRFGHASGLESFIYGKTASLLVGDALVIGIVGLACVLISLILLKELRLLCFDEGFAGSIGLPIWQLDALLMSLIVVVTIIGLQAVGLILMIALLVIPPAAARFWTQGMSVMIGISAAIGAASCFVGAMISAMVADLPSGATIVLVASSCFVISFFWGAQRGVLIRWTRRRQLQRKIQRQHLLRALYEIEESRRPLSRRTPARDRVFATFAELLEMRSWSPRSLRGELRTAEREGLVVRAQPDQIRLTESGFHAAARLVHQHRLWEMYLITHADIAASKVDRDADAIEHVLTPTMIRRLEQLLDPAPNLDAVTMSPHPIFPPGEATTGVEGDR